MHILKELLTMYKELITLHILPVSIVAVLWLLSLLKILRHKILSLPSRTKPIFKLSCFVVSVVLVTFFVINTILFFLSGNYKSPSLGITMAIGFLILGVVLFAICFQPYIVFWRNNIMHTLGIFFASLLVLSSSLALIYSLPSALRGLEIETDNIQQTVPSDAQVDPNEKSEGINSEDNALMIENHIGEKTTTSAGTLFAFWAGTATLIALLYTISSLHAQHTRISTYRQYLRESSFVLDKYLDSMRKEIYEFEEKLLKKKDHLMRDRRPASAVNNNKDKNGHSEHNQSRGKTHKAQVRELIEEIRGEKRKQFYESHSVRMLCFTPLNGNVSLGLAAAELISYKISIQHLLERAEEGWLKLEIICLYDDDELYRNELNECSHDREKLVKAAEADCDLAQLYLGFSTQHDFENEGDNLWQAYSESLEYIKDVSSFITAKRRINLPTYHFMITKNPKKAVAIVGNPLRLPPPFSKPATVEPHNRNKKQNVEMIGFRTEEVHIVESLEETFTFYGELSV